MSTDGEAPTSATPATTEGGYGWLVVAGGFVAHFVALGIVYTFGIFFLAIVADFGDGQGATAWIIAVANAVMLGSAGLTGRLADRLGHGRIIAAGAVAMGGGLLLTSVATSLVQVILAYGLLIGIGASMTFVPAIGAVGQWFTKRRGLAIGMAVAGAGVGTMAVSPLSEWMISTQGWRFAMRVLAGMCLMLGLGAAMVVRGRVLRTLGGDQSGRPSWRNRTLRLLCIGALVGGVGYMIPFVFLAPYAKDVGLSTAAGATLLAVLGGANLIGRVVLGWAADRLGRLRVLQGATLLMALSMLLWPQADDSISLMAVAASYGLFAGGQISLTPALLGEYFGVRHLAGLIGTLYSCAAIGSLAGPPLVGALFERLGSYNLPIILAGAMLVINFFVLMRLPEPQPEQ